MAWLRELWTTGRSTVALGLAVTAIIIALFSILSSSPKPDRYQLLSHGGWRFIRLDRQTGEVTAYRLQNQGGGRYAFKPLASTLDAPLDAFQVPPAEAETAEDR